MRMKYLAIAIIMMSILFSVAVIEDADQSEGVTTYSITVGVADTGCSVTISSPGQSSQTVTAVDYVTMTVSQGASVTLTASAGTGYTFEQWTNRQNLTLLSTNSTYTFVPTGDMIISGDFDYLTGYTISLSIPSTDTGCSATLSSGGSSETASVNEWVRMNISQGASVTLTASAGTGYTFGKWVNMDTSSTISSNSTYTFTPSGDMEISGDFDPITYTITFVTSPNGYGTITEYGSFSSVPYGTEYLIIGDMFEISIYTYAFAEPNADSGGYRYSFDSWSIPDETTGTVTGDMTVTAYFTRTALTTVTLSVDAQYTGCSATIYSEGRSKTVNAGNSDTFSFGQGSTVSLGANQGVSFTFSKWTSTNGDLSTNNPYSTTSLVSGMTIQPIFALATTTTVFYQNYNSSDLTVYDVKGQTLGYTFTLPSNPTRAGYTFNGWFTDRNGGTQITSSTTVTADAPTSLYAHWSNAQYTLTFIFSNGDPNQSTTVTYLSTYGSGGWPQDPTRAGYTFAGWFTDITGGTEVESTDTFTNTSNTSLYAHWTALGYTLTFNPNGGLVIPSSTTVQYLSTYGSGGWPTPTKTGYQFTGWYTTISGGDKIESTDTYSIIGDQTLYAHWTDPYPPGSVLWSNDLYNGSISMAFKFSGSSNMTHEMIIPLYTGVVNERQETTWTESIYTLNVSVSYNGINTTIVSSIDTGGNPGNQVVKVMGNWSGFVLDMNLSTGYIAFTPMDTFTDFTNYTIIGNQRVTVFTWDETDNATAYIINHSDSGNGSRARFSVVNTWTFLNTFGVVLNNPSINVYEYFPQYEQVRVNLYAFAVYGESLTINGKSWDVIGSTITIYYTEDSSGNYVYATQSTEGAQSRNLTLSNIFITWDGTDCYLSFDSDDFTVNLGAYSNGSETFSFTGLWYFTISLMEPYSATKTVVSGDWDSLLDIDSSAILLIFLGIMTLMGLICHMKLGLKWLDFAIVIVSMVVAFTMLG